MRTDPRSFSLRCAATSVGCIDGPPAAGKTTLADELAVVVRALGREVIRASTDGFHLPRAQRYRKAMAVSFWDGLKNSLRGMAARS